MTSGDPPLPEVQRPTTSSVLLVTTHRQPVTSRLSFNTPSHARERPQDPSLPLELGDAPYVSVTTLPFAGKFPAAALPLEAPHHPHRVPQLEGLVLIANRVCLVLRGNYFAQSLASGLLTRNAEWTKVPLARTCGNECP